MVEKKNVETVPKEIDFFSLLWFLLCLRLSVAVAVESPDSLLALAAWILVVVERVDTVSSSAAAQFRCDDDRMDVFMVGRCGMIVTFASEIVVSLCVLVFVAS